VNEGDAVGTRFGFGREGCVGLEWLFNGGAADCFFGAVLFFLNGDGYGLTLWERRSFSMLVVILFSVRGVYIYIFN
jgi:hypothetical protein